MFFVHPQIKFNINSFKKVLNAFLKSPNAQLLAKKLSWRFPEKQCIFTDMGRSAFKIIIEQLNLRNSEILFPAYICDIFYPIFKQYNIRPIFLDINLETFHVSSQEIERKITPQTKAIFICHTYGLPFDVSKIKQPLLIIEDCAHYFKVGKLTNASFFSLYKFLPTLRGGLLVCPKDWQVTLAKTYFNLRDLISLLNCFPFFAFLFKTFGNKVAPKMLRKEKGKKIGNLNNFSINLFQNFIKDFENNLEKRIALALFFQEELKKLGFVVQESTNNTFCYLSALVPKNLNRDKLVKQLTKYGIFCTRIWHTPIILNPEAQKEYNLNLSEFPNTVEAAKRIINLPLQNYFQRKDIEKIIKKLKFVLDKIGG